MLLHFAASPTPIPPLSSPDNQTYNAVRIVFKHVSNIRNKVTIVKGGENKEVLRVQYLDFKEGTYTKLSVSIFV